MILSKWPTWRTILYYEFIFIFNCLHVSSTSCSSSGETNCVNTSSGNCDSVYCRWPCRVVCRSEVNFRPAHDTATDIEWQLPEVVLTQFCLCWWWARCARNMQTVKNKNKFIVKNCASRWSFTKTDYEFKNGISIVNSNSASMSGYVIWKLHKISTTVNLPELKADISPVSNSNVTDKGNYVSYLNLLFETW